MRIPELSIRRPVTVLMLVSIIIVLGGISFVQLPIELMPDLAFPTAAVLTGYEGVASEDIETLVTKPVEAAVSKVKNVKTVTSTSQEGLSIVVVELEWGTNIDFAAQDMRDSIGVVLDYLPADIDDPIVVKFDPAMIPVIAYGITGRRDLRELRTLVDDDIRDRVEMVDGVASAVIMGGREREIQVLVDPARLEALGIPVWQVVARLRAENVNLSGGHATHGQTEYLLRTLGEFEGLEQIRNTLVAVQGGAPVYVRDLAEVVDTHKEVRSGGRVGGQQGLILSVIKESGANTAEVVSAVKRRVAELKGELPPDIGFHVALDQGDLTEKIVNSTAKDALWGGLVAAVLILLALRSWRPTLTIILSIPLSILATLVVLHALGFTLNTMTMSSGAGHQRGGRCDSCVHSHHSGRIPADVLRDGDRREALPRPGPHRSRFALCLAARGSDSRPRDGIAAISRRDRAEAGIRREASAGDLLQV